MMDAALQPIEPSRGKHKIILNRTISVIASLSTALIGTQMPVMTEPSPPTPPTQGEFQVTIPQHSLKSAQVDGSRLKVSVTAWPNQQKLADLDPEESVPLLDLPVTEVGAGQYRIDARSAAGDYVEGNAVNFEVTIRVGDENLTWNGVASGDEKAPREAQIDLASRVVTTQGGRTRATPYVKKVREIWAGGYGWSGATARADFNIGAEHRLGIAGPDGQLGEAVISTKAGATATGIVDRYITNYVDYRRYNYRCGLKNITYKYVPHSFHSLLPNGDFPKAPDLQCKNPQNCTAVTKGFSGYKEQGRNFIISNGVTVKGVTVSAQAGWNKEARIGWDVTKPSWLCGDNNGWVKAQQVTARIRR